MLEVMGSMGSAETVVFYAVADTSEGSIRLKDGGAITREDLAGMMDGLDAGTKAILIVEGPKSGVFGQAGVFREGTTVITSSSERDRNNVMRPWDASFSAHFLEKCRQGRPVRECFDLAQLLFLNPFAGQVQNPVLVEGDLAGSVLQGRFMAMELPDLTAPEIAAVEPTDLAGMGVPVEVRVRVSDNRDRVGEIRVEGKVSSLGGETLETIVFIPPGSGEAFHRGSVTQVSPLGFGLTVTARDRAGNEGEPLNVWLTDSSNGLIYDLDGDGDVEGNDLLELLRLRTKGLLQDDWPFDFMPVWMETVNE
jgi:hypothetical protein